LSEPICVADVAQQIHWYLEETKLDEIFAAELAQRFAVAVEEPLEFLARTPGAGCPRGVRFSDLRAYRRFNVFEPFGRFRVYFRVSAEEIHVERLLCKRSAVRASSAERFIRPLHGAHPSAWPLF
jgi:hypothetical protein